MYGDRLLKKKKRKDVPCLPDMLGAPLKLNIPFHPELLQTDQNNDIFSKYICNLPAVSIAIMFALMSTFQHIKIRRKIQIIST